METQDPVVRKLQRDCIPGDAPAATPILRRADIWRYSPVLTCRSAVRVVLDCKADRIGENTLSARVARYCDRTWKFRVSLSKPQVKNG
jgi:hypothetical protein